MFIHSRFISTSNYKSSQPHCSYLYMYVLFTHAHTQPDRHLSQYLVQWRDGGSTLQAGVMKVFAPAALHKWRNEVNTLSMVAAQPHTNLAQYHWQTPHNNYTAAICTFSRQIASPESRYDPGDHVGLLLLFFW